MAKKRTAKKKPARSKRQRKGLTRPVRWLFAWGVRLSILVVVTAILVVSAHAVMTPPKTYYMRQEAKRLGEIDYVWVPYEEVAPVMARSVVAAEDANFCMHWGFDMTAIREAIEAGGNRGASTISQQTVKNVYLWHGQLADLWCRASPHPRREGERGAERLVRVEFPDGQVEHYEGERDAEQAVRVERPSGDATIVSESYV